MRSRNIWLQRVTAVLYNDFGGAGPSGGSHLTFNGRTCLLILLQFAPQQLGEEPVQVLARLVVELQQHVAQRIDARRWLARSSDSTSVRISAPRPVRLTVTSSTPSATSCRHSESLAPSSFLARDSLTTFSRLKSTDFSPLVCGPNWRGYNCGRVTLWGGRKRVLTVVRSRKFAERQQRQRDRLLEIAFDDAVLAGRLSVRVTRSVGPSAAEVRRTANEFKRLSSGNVVPAPPVVMDICARAERDPEDKVTGWTDIAIFLGRDPKVVRDAYRDKSNEEVRLMIHKRGGRYHSTPGELLNLASFFLERRAKARQAVAARQARGPGPKRGVRSTFSGSKLK